MTWWANCCCNCGWGPYAFQDSSQDPVANLGFSATPFAGNQAWAIAGGTLNTPGGFGSLWKGSGTPKPSPSHSGLLMQAACLRPSSNAQQSGIFIGNARRFSIDWAGGHFVQQPCDVTGNATGDPVTLAGTIPSGTGGLGLGVFGNLDGTFSIKYLLNGGELSGSAETDVELPALEAAGRVQAGVWSLGAAQFDNAQLSCGFPASCCQGVPPTLCGRIINQAAHLGSSDAAWEMVYDPSGDAAVAAGFTGRPAVGPGWVGIVPAKGGLPTFALKMDLNCALWWTPITLTLVPPPVDPSLKGCSPGCTPFSKSYQMRRSAADAWTVLLTAVPTLCTRKPGFLSLDTGSPISVADAACDVQVSPVTVTLASRNCPAFNGVTFPITLSGFSDGNASWVGNFTAGGSSYRFTLIWNSIGVGVAGHRWGAAIQLGGFSDFLTSNLPENIAAPYFNSLSTSNSDGRLVNLACPGGGGTAIITAFLTP